ncbi:hypothetical protein FA95DRAFT_1555877 [Auriscalpium vulgare]|uniref:Uncharacterized protein n=1 Tax=Auriscalpium vulgare TaxID=40419 RepID=A0ACB8S218_9AGAM|nr:hypothetical protein FA95DRAFT_1555877 [Auriscalpium vulgare]
MTRAPTHGTSSASRCARRAVSQSPRLAACKDRGEGGTSEESRRTTNESKGLEAGELSPPAPLSTSAPPYRAAMYVLPAPRSLTTPRLFERPSWNAVHLRTPPS